MPQTLFLKLVRKLFPGVEKRFVRTLTVQRTRTLQAFPTSGTHPTQFSNKEVKNVPYITFEAIVGRNSKFHKLTEENLEELGGVEYRALTALLWIVGAVSLSPLLFCPPHNVQLCWLSVSLRCPVDRIYDNYAVHQPSSLAR